MLGLADGRMKALLLRKGVVDIKVGGQPTVSATMRCGVENGSLQ